MNIRNVLRTYSLLRQLTDDEAALLETLRNFNDSEREAFVEALSDKPAGKKAGKKASTSKSSQSSSKSSRASGMAAQLKERRQEQQETTKDDNYHPEAERCTFPRDGGKLCFLLPDHNVHHMKSAVGFHSFQSSSDASSADSRSPANGGAESIIANSVDGTDDVGTVAHGASGGPS